MAYHILCLLQRFIWKLNRKQQVPEGSERDLLENRETGESPVRSRHCEQQCIANDVTEKSGRRQYALRCEPGDLPAVVRGF